MDEPSVPSPARLLHEVGKVLDAEHIRWAAIGALAVAIHGLVRASLDADALITLRNSALDLEGLAGKLRAKGWIVDTRVGDEGDPLGFVLRIQDGAGNQADLIGGIRRLDPGFFDRSAPINAAGLSMQVASPEDLLALKIFAGGPRDLEDAAGILDVLGKSFDRNFALDLCRGFGSQEETACRDLMGRHPLV